MSRTAQLRIRIDDLPPVELLTPEEEAELFGAGPRKRVLGVEALEDRQLMTAGLSTALSNGILNVTVPVAGDLVTIRSVNSQLVVSDLSTVSNSFALSQVNQINVNTSSGTSAIDALFAGSIPITLQHTGLANSFLLEPGSNLFLNGTRPLGAVTNLVTGAGGEIFVSKNVSQTVQGSNVTTNRAFQVNNAGVMTEMNYASSDGGLVSSTLYQGQDAQGNAEAYMVKYGNLYRCVGDTWEELGSANRVIPLNTGETFVLSGSTLYTICPYQRTSIATVTGLAEDTSGTNGVGVFRLSNGQLQHFANGRWQTDISTGVTALAQNGMLALVTAQDGVTTYRATLSSSGQLQLILHGANASTLATGMIDQVCQGVLFGPGGPSVADTMQTDHESSCFIISSLNAIVEKDPNAIQNMITDLGNGTYAVRFQYNGQMVTCLVDNTLSYNPSANQGAGEYGPAGVLQDSNGQNVLWPALIVKAYAYFKALTTANTTSSSALVNVPYSAIEDGNPGTTMSYLGAVGISTAVWNLSGTTLTQTGTGNFMSSIGMFGVTLNQNTLNPSQEVTSFLSSLQSQLASGQAVTLGYAPGPKLSAGQAYTIPNNSSQLTDALVPWHTYMVVSVQTNSTGAPVSLTLLNPWKIDGCSPSDYSSSSHLGVYNDCVNDGYITLQAAQLNGYQGLVVSSGTPVDSWQAVQSSPIQVQWMCLAGHAVWLATTEGSQSLTPGYNVQSFSADSQGTLYIVANGTVSVLEPNYVPNVPTVDQHGNLLPQVSGLPWKQVLGLTSVTGFGVDTSNDLGVVTGGQLYRFTRRTVINAVDDGTSVALGVPVSPAGATNISFDNAGNVYCKIGVGVYRATLANASANLGSWTLVSVSVVG